jgi:hypothetical protein
LKIENEFGLVSGILLDAILIVSVIWIVARNKTISLYQFMGQEIQRFVKHKEALDRRLAL